MKRILIAGANSYVGDNTKSYLESINSSEYQVDILNMIGEEWKKCKFSNYDVIVNVCAIVHRPEEKAEEYYKVNRDLAIELARRCKESGVKQFIQMSTASVFGVDLGVVNKDTKLEPYSDYGKSKLDADIMLQNLMEKSFRVCIIRPPMIYGKGCKGNFPRLEKFAMKSPVFPSLRNKKDFIYINNMMDFIKYAIDKQINGIFYPRDKEPTSTSYFVEKIAEVNGKKIYLSGIFNPFVKIAIKFNHTFTLVFGDNYYDIDDKSNWEAPYSLEEAINEIYKW